MFFSLARFCPAISGAFALPRLFFLPFWLDDKTMQGVKYKYCIFIGKSDVPYV